MISFHNPCYITAVILYHVQIKMSIGKSIFTCVALCKGTLHERAVPSVLRTSPYPVGSHPAPPAKGCFTLLKPNFHIFLSLKG